MKICASTMILLACSAEAFQPLPMRRNAPISHDYCCYNRRQVPGSKESLVSLAVMSDPAMSTTNDSFLKADRTMTTFELPEIAQNRTLTKTEQEFRDFLSDFAHFSERDIRSVPSPRMRTLFDGVKASAGEQAVYRSFEALFCDYMPIRLAGRLIYKKLQCVMADSQTLRQQQVESVAETTGLAEEEVDMLRIAFLSIAEENHYKDGQVFVTKQQLEESGIGDIVLNELGYANVDAFFKILNHPDGRLSFEEVMEGLYSYAVETCYNDAECDPSQVLHTLLMPLLDNDTSNYHRTLDDKHQRFSDRYDEMIHAFSEWGSFSPSGEGRQLDVLRGCFVGARNEKVLEALRIVYVDYRPLRVAGNLIFSLMKALVNSGQK